MQQVVEQAGDEGFSPLVRREDLPRYAEDSTMELYSRRAAIEVDMWAARFQLLTHKGRVLEFLLAAAQRPFGRLHLSTRSTRQHDIQLRAAFCVEVWRIEMARSSPLTASIIYPPCDACGRPTGDGREECESCSPHANHSPNGLWFDGVEYDNKGWRKQ
jgi:hypothetical protein